MLLTDIDPKHPATRRIFSVNRLSPQEIECRRQAKRQLNLRCRSHFEKIRDRLLQTHYNWSVAIEPESGYYLIDKDWEKLLKRTEIYCPKSEMMIYGINQKGTCGRL